jgi:hypothetical protein
MVDSPRRSAERHGSIPYPERADVAADDRPVDCADVDISTAQPTEEVRDPDPIRPLRIRRTSPLREPHHELARQLSSGRPVNREGRWPTDGHSYREALNRTTHQSRPSTALNRTLRSRQNTRQAEDQVAPLPPPAEPAPLELPIHDVAGDELAPIISQLDALAHELGCPVEENR